MSAGYFVVTETTKWCGEKRKAGDVIYINHPILLNLLNEDKDKFRKITDNKTVIALDSQAIPFIFKKNMSIRDKEYKKSDFIFFTYKTQARSLKKFLRQATNDEYREYLLKLVGINLEDGEI